MKVICLNSLSLSRILATAVLLALASIHSGCATMTALPTVAPRSNVSRDNAIALARITAATVGGQVYTVAPTGSMKPTLDESSVVTVEKAPFETLRQGDIVIYRSATGTPVIHRLYEQQGNRWLVLGDNNGSIDREAVTTGNLLGRVCAIFYTSSGAQLEGNAALARRE